MSRISRAALAKAILKVQAMDTGQKEQLAGEVFLAQPNMLAAFAVQKQFGVSLVKMDFVAEIMLICFQAMKESGLTWPVISQDEQECQMQRYVAMVKFGEDMSERLRAKSVQQTIDDHPEKELFAHVQSATAQWLARIVPEESDKYVMMAVATFVNCIAYVPMPAVQARPSRKKSGKAK